MDARSVAATAANHGALTPATEVEYDDSVPAYHYDSLPYDHKVFDGIGQPDKKEELVYGPSIKPWPSIEKLNENVLLKVAAWIDDPVTTTDELIPSGETSSYRSDPYALSEFALSRKVPEYVGRAKAVRTLEKARQEGENCEELNNMYDSVKNALGLQESADQMKKNTSVGSVVYANKPGDGSAREQAASCQRVLGGAANIALEYATKRYRSNVMNWGMLPFLTSYDDSRKLAVGDLVYVPNVREILLGDTDEYKGFIVRDGKKVGEIALHLGAVEPSQKEILAAGCLINYYAGSKK